VQFLVSASYPLSVLNKARGVVVVMVCADDVLIQPWQQNLCNNTDDDFTCCTSCRLRTPVHCFVLNCCVSYYTDYILARPINAG
jgi:hypothetical protein